MSKNTDIKWTESTWNPITGCTKISAGCKNCYALRDWEKLSKKEGSVYWNRNFNDIAFHDERLDQPLRWSKSRKIFVNSMSDLFHEKLDFTVIDKIFLSMMLANWHTYQVLTKRPDIMVNYLEERMPFLIDAFNDKTILNHLFPSYKKIIANSGDIKAPFHHIWLGVSIEDKKAAAERLPLMKKITKYSEVAWISAEPLLEPYSLKGFEHEIDWLVLGGESGPNARIMQEDWVKHFVNECETLNIPFLFKQWGEFAPINGVMTKIGVSIAGDLVDGQNFNAYPKKIKL